MLRSLLIMIIMNATFAEAEKAQKEIQKNDNPQAWILIESL